MHKLTQIGVLVGGGTKNRLIRAAKKNGRTLSGEVVHMIEKVSSDYYQAANKQMIEDFLQRREQTIKDLESGNPERVAATLIRHGYSRVAGGWSIRDG
jgi:hypothetical protein